MNRLKKRVRDIKYQVGCDNPDTDAKLIYPYVRYLRRETSFNGNPHMNNVMSIREQLAAKNRRPRVMDVQYMFGFTVLNETEDSDL